jgi:hypothetical protein
VKESSIALRVECRRSLHHHAVDARENGWSAIEWEEWSTEFASELVATVGEKEMDCLVRFVWGL